MVRNKLEFLQANCGDPDQMLLTASSTLGLHCLPTSKNWTVGLNLLEKKLTFLPADCEDPNQILSAVHSVATLFVYV